MAVGAGWQAAVAYVNVGCYYAFGVPLGLLMGFMLDWGVTVSLSTLMPPFWNNFSYNLLYYRFFFKKKKKKNDVLQGIWSGMIGGTILQTCILIWMVHRTNWDTEVSLCNYL